MWSGIKVETMIIIPDNGLNIKREGTEMTLMCYGSNKLNQRTKTYQHEDMNKLKINPKEGQNTNMLKRITGLFGGRGHQTRTTHPIQQILAEKYYFLGVKFDPVYMKILTVSRSTSVC